MSSDFPRFVRWMAMWSIRRVHTHWKSTRKRATARLKPRLQAATRARWHEGRIEHVIICNGSDQNSSIQCASGRYLHSYQRTLLTLSMEQFCSELELGAWFILLYWASLLWRGKKAHKRLGVVYFCSTAVVVGCVQWIHTLNPEVRYKPGSGPPSMRIKFQ